MSVKTIQAIDDANAMRLIRLVRSLNDTYGDVVEDFMPFSLRFDNYSAVISFAGMPVWSNDITDPNNVGSAEHIRAQVMYKSRTILKAIKKVRI